MTSLSEPIGGCDFIQTLRAVKAHDAKLHINRESWAHVFDRSFDSLLFMCIGTVCNSNFETSVRQSILHDDAEYVRHKNNVLNLFLFVAHLGLHYRVFHVTRADIQRRRADDTLDYAYYFVSHLKGELIFRIAELVHTFCVRKRMVRVEKVMKYFKRVPVYDNLRALVHRHVTRIIAAVEEQIELTGQLVRGPRSKRPRTGSVRV